MSWEIKQAECFNDHQNGIYGDQLYAMLSLYQEIPADATLSPLLQTKKGQLERLLKDTQTSMEQLQTMSRWLGVHETKKYPDGQVYAKWKRARQNG